MYVLFLACTPLVDWSTTGFEMPSYGSCSCTDCTPCPDDVNVISDCTATADYVCETPQGNLIKFVEQNIFLQIVQRAFFLYVIFGFL